MRCLNIISICACTHNTWKGEVEVSNCIHAYERARCVWRFLCCVVFVLVNHPPPHQRHLLAEQKNRNSKAKARVDGRMFVMWVCVNCTNKKSKRGICLFIILNENWKVCERVPCGISFDVCECVCMSCFVLKKKSPKESKESVWICADERTAHTFHTHTLKSSRENWSSFVCLLSSIFHLIHSHHHITISQIPIASFVSSSVAASSSSPLVSQMNN